MRGACTVLSMSRPPVHDAETFAERYLLAHTLTALADALGQSKSAVSARAARLRARGFDLPPFGRGRGLVLPKILQVPRWEWVEAPGLRKVHRRRLGHGETLCGVQLVRARRIRDDEGGHRCATCWPIDTYPPTIGRLPLPEPGAPGHVVAERGAGRCIFLRLDAPGRQWVDLETDETYKGRVRANRWWALNPKRTKISSSGEHAERVGSEHD